MSHQKYGVPEAAPATTTLGGILHHPLNPSYTTVQKPKLKTLPSYGYALVEEELSKRELDDEILSKENVILQQRLMNDDESSKDNSPSTIRKLNQNDSKFIDTPLVEFNSNFMDANNNNVSSNSNTSSIIKRNKSSLNASDESSCPGLASPALVTYKSD